MPRLTRYPPRLHANQPGFTAFGLRLLLGAALLFSGCSSLARAGVNQVAQPSPASPASAAKHLRGLVIDLNGNPVAGAQVVSRAASSVTGPDGWFDLDTSAGQWVTVRHSNFISRTRAAQGGRPVLFRLTPQDGKTISILFTGDVMFGRRFFDPNEDGDLSDGLLPENPALPDHLRLIDPVRPLLENADLTVINFESAVSNHPALNILQARPSEYHQEKDYVYSSHPSSLTALKQSGVDLVFTGNNHMYDLLDPGVEQTLQALANAGFPSGETSFGLGMSEAQAWKPAAVEIDGQKLAFTGCTSISRGLNGGLDYVASDAEEKGGAASCTVEQIKASVANLSKAGAVPITVLHGGYEYDPLPSEMITASSRAARKAGSPLVIAHHPHVLSGLDWDGQSLTAWSLGNFIFDQTLWPTFPSMVLVVHLREGKVIHAYTEPLMIEDYLPAGLTGDEAETVAREIAGYSSPSFVMEDGSVESDFNGQAKAHFTQLDLKNETGAARSVPSGAWVHDFSGPGTLRLGRDLLRVGDFEDNDIDGQAGENRFWTFTPPDKVAGKDYAYHGLYGAHLERGAGNLEPAVLAPTHRILVKAGDSLTMTGMGRSPNGAQPELQLSWYTDTKGPSAEQTALPLHLTQDWAPFSLDAAVPEGVVAVGLFLKLPPPESGSVSADFDDLRLVDWVPPGGAYSSLYDYYRLEGSGVVTFEQDILPGWDLFEKVK